MPKRPSGSPTKRFTRSGKFTTCDAEDPHFHFHLSKAIMVPNDKVVSGPLYLKFRKDPDALGVAVWVVSACKKKEPRGACRVTEMGATWGSF